MSKDLDIIVAQDHIESLTRASGISALSELIWNGLDADATEVNVSFKKNALGHYDEIKIIDNGHGLTYQKAEEVFKKLGGSDKKNNTSSPSGRSYHGKEGKGRYKSFALGDLVLFESIYSENGVSRKFNIQIDRNNLRKPVLSDLEVLNDSLPSSFTVNIYNINDKWANEVFNKESKIELQEKFASYYISYPHFKITINTQPLDFDSLIKNTHEDDIFINHSDVLSYKFKIKIIEWNFDNKKKMYFCNEKGIPFRENNLGIRSSLPISIFIQSVYIETLHRENRLDILELDSYLEEVVNQAKRIARSYVRSRLHFYSKEFINELKKENLYPYKEEPQEEIEKATRQVFDIVALQLNEFLPSFSEQDNISKKLTLALIKEALENDGSNLQKILTEVIGLPDDKRDELSELLDKTSLVNIIDTMTDVTNRLILLHALELLIYDPEHSEHILERRHLHKIVVNETWIFGDQYTYGADDITLKNVLSQYLNYLGRENIEEIINSADNDDLQTIPDICLWKQFSTGAANGYVNLVIELKKPTVDAGAAQLTQIQSYAQSVMRDARFPKEKTKWIFILLTRDIKDEISLQLNQNGRKYGHVTQNENCDIWVLKWGNVISDAKARYSYVKNKLNINFQDNANALQLLRDKYKQYLPSDF
jgi:hypothetical protein